MQIILGSASPRRKEILENAGVCFTVCPADVDESTDIRDPSEMVRELSRRKTNALDAGEAIVITADTVVAIDGEILGKPKNEEDARRMLRLLSGRVHQVFTGVSVKYKDTVETFCEKTDVYFKEIDDAAIDAYVRSGEPMDKAGAYAIQGRGAVFIEKIDGDYLNVVGLPWSRLYDILRSDFGYTLY